MFKKKKYAMNKAAAAETLNNVFAACNKTPNRINFDLLIIKGIAQTNLVSTCKWIATGLVFVVLVLPISLINDNFKVETENINRNKIIISDHKLYTDCFVLTLEGNDIAYESIYAKDSDGKIIFPKEIDKESNVIIFPYNEKSLTISILDNEGHSLVAQLSESVSKKQPAKEN